MAVQFGIQFVVAEADGGGFGPAVGEDDAFDVRPVGRGQAHRAGFAGGVERAAGQVEVAECRAGAADGADFSMRCRVAVGDDAVPVFGDDFSIADDDGAERATIAQFAAFLGQFDGTGEKLVIRIHRVEVS